MLQTYEIVALVVLVFILFGGATQIPKVARALGRAKGEYQSARKDFEAEVSKAEQDAKGPGVATAYGGAPAQGLGDRSKPADTEEIRRAAREMGIETEGRSTQDLKAEINRRLA